MLRTSFAFALIAAHGLGLASIPVMAQPMASTDIAADAAASTIPVQPGDPPSAAAPATCCRLAAGTQVELELGAQVTSWEHKRGDKFALRLAEPLQVDGVELLPAGTSGTGEVVHAAAARGGGAPGELILAARHLDHACGPVPLRAFKLGGSGGDNSGMALGVSFAAGPFAMFIRGHEIEIPEGTRVTAKLASDIELVPGGDCPAGSDPASSDPADPDSDTDPTHPATE